MRMANEQMKVSDYQLKEVDVRLCLKETATYFSDRPMDSPSAAVEVIKDVVKDLAREIICVVNLDSRLRPLNYHVVAMGDTDACLCSVRSIFKSAVLSNAANVMLFHNHPSGIPEPSPPDIKMTESVVAAGKLMGIRVLDHIIIGGGTGETFSFLSDERFRDMFFSSVADKKVIGELLSVADDKPVYVTNTINTEELAKDYSRFKEKLFVRLCNISQNEELVNRCLHRNIDDEIALMYCVNATGELSDPDMVYCEYIDNELYVILEKQGITPEQIENDALENGAKTFPCKIELLEEGLIFKFNEKSGDPEMEEILVVHTPESVAGAAAVFYPDVMDKLAEKCRGDFFAIPSSVHDFIIVPERIIPRDLYKLFQSKLFQPCSPLIDKKDLESFLSDKIFHYDSREKIFEKADAWEMRMKDMNIEIR